MKYKIGIHVFAFNASFILSLRLDYFALRFVPIFYSSIGPTASEWSRRKSRIQETPAFVNENGPESLAMNNSKRLSNESKRKSHVEGITLDDLTFKNVHQ